MHYSPGTRALALIAGLLVAAATPALAQDTTEMGGAPMDTLAPEAGAIDTAGVDSAAADTADTSATDTSGVQNPAGYRGMERDTTMFPDSGGPPAEAGQVEDQATGTYDDSTWQDTTGAEQNPEDSVTVGETEPQENQSAEPRIEPEGSAADTAAPQ